MWKKLTTLFGSKRSVSKFDKAEGEFDRLMKRVEEDQNDLGRLEGHMREKWTEVHQELESVKEEVDAAVEEEAFG